MSTHTNCMKRNLLSSLVLVAALVIPLTDSRAESSPADTAVPPHLLEELREYAEKGLSPAQNKWIRGSPLAQSGQVEQAAAAILNVERVYGKMVGHEIVRVVPVSPSVRRVYIILRYELGPLYGIFDSYRTASGCFIPGFWTHLQPQTFLPPDVLAGAR